MSRLLVILGLSLCSLFTYAQQKQEIKASDYENSRVEMADNFRSEGKIYVLTAVIVIILGGIFIYLFAMDRKIHKLEKHIKKD